MQGARAREGIEGALGRALVGWQLPDRRRGADCFVPLELENWGWRVCRPDSMGGAVVAGHPPLPAGGCWCARWSGGPGRAAGRGRDACRAGEESRPCHRGAGCGRSRRRAGRGTVTRGVRGAWCAALVGVQSRAPGGTYVVPVAAPSSEGGRRNTFSSGPTVRLGNPSDGVNCDGSAMGRGLREARCALGTVPVNGKG